MALGAAWPESGLYRVLLGLWALIGRGAAALKAAWPESGICRALDRFGAWASRQSKGSAVCALVSREGALDAAWPGSWTCRAMALVTDLPCKVGRALGRWAPRILKESALCRAVAGIGSLPFLAVGAVLGFMLLVPHALWNNLYALALALVLVVVFAAGAAVKPSHRMETERLGPWFCFFLLMAMGAFFTSRSWSLSVRFVGFYLTLFLLVVLIVSSVRRYEQLQLLVALAVGGLTIAAVYGCYQGIVGVPVVANQQDMIVNAGMPGRIYSFFDNPNNFAELLVMLMPLSAALCLNARTWRGRLAAAGSFVVCLISLALTLSRSGFLGLVFAAVVFLAFENWRLIPAFLLLGLCCLPLLPQTVYNRIMTIGNTQDTSTSYRFAIYDASAKLMKDYWFQGVGLGSDVLKEAFEGYPRMFDGNYPIHTHNNYLQVWAEMGLFGLISFLGALAWQVKKGVRAYRACADRRVQRMLAAAVAGFCGILLISIAEYTWFYPRNMFIYWSLFAVIGACVKLAGRPAKKP